MTRQVVFTVKAIGSVGAAEIAKREARLSGMRVVTVASIHPVLGQTGDPRKDPMSWTVALAVKS